MTTAIESQDRKQVILDCAEELACRRGYDSFSYADIEKAVGIKKPSIHYHFPTKADLARALMERYIERSRAALTEIVEREPRAAGQLIDYLDMNRAALSGGRNVCLGIAFSAARESLDEAVRSEVARFHDAVREWLEGLFARALHDHSIRDVSHPADEAMQALALAQGGMLLARAASDTMRFETAVASLRSRTRN